LTQAELVTLTLKLTASLPTINAVTTATAATTIATKGIKNKSAQQQTTTFVGSRILKCIILFSFYLFLVLHLFT